MRLPKIRFNKILISSFFIFLLLFAFTNSSLALSPEQRRLIGSGARYFDLDVGCASDPANGKIYFLGDSLTVDMRDQGQLEDSFESEGWTDVNVQATDGDNIANALTKAEADKTIIEEASTVVIGLGTNRDPDFGVKLPELINKLRGFNEEAIIYWVNVHTGPGALVEGGDARNDGVNQEINAQSTALGYSVINWKGEVTANPETYPFTEDNVHHTAEGSIARSEFLAEIIGTPPAALPGASSQAGTATELVGDTNEEKIFNYLLGKEVAGQPLKDFHVAGILGNMWAESGYRPQRLQNTTPDVITTADQARTSNLGWGLVQWTPAGKMINPTIDGGKDPNDMQVQLDFLLEQLNGQGPIGEGRAGQDLIATTDVGGATISFETKYERHKGAPQPDRIVEAQRILDEGFSGAGGGCGGGDSDLSSKVLEYAWPDYRDPPYTQKKPEYETAISTAQASGQYVGGGSHPGVDCGGWVTRLMIDSGFEPNYNFGGSTADGASNVSGGQIQWIQANWDKITVGGTQDLKPGDVAINTGRSHTFAFVGDIEGFDSQIASSSYSTTGQSWRAPMAGREDALASNIEWYRQR